MGLAFVLACQSSIAQQSRKDSPNLSQEQNGKGSASRQISKENKEGAARVLEKPGFQILARRFQKASEVAALISSVYKQGSMNGNESVANLRIVADERTNSLLVAAPPALMKEVAALVEKLDVQTPNDRADEQKLMVFPLKGLPEDDRFLREALAVIIDKNAKAKYVLDARGNALIVYGDEKTRFLVEGLCGKLQNLEAMAKSSKPVAHLSPAPAMQIRVLWLVDSSNKEVGGPLSGDVLSIGPALSKLGINHPRLLANCLVNNSGGTFKSSGRADYGVRPRIPEIGRELQVGGQESRSEHRPPHRYRRRPERGLASLFAHRNRNPGALWPLCHHGHDADRRLDIRFCGAGYRGGVR